MALSLSKKIAWIVACMITCTSVFSQVAEHDPSDYKERDQFERFSKRKNVVAAWQINQLKGGALVVRLKTNKKLIDALKSEGNTKLAEEKELEQFVINKNTMLAYMDNMRFCKVYFIYSNSSDTLMHGARVGMFLDTNMVVNKDIELKEKFYMIAERDYAYNSSIGFVAEDSAKYIAEKGNPVKAMAIVIKNKYGQQAKGPFPYFVKEKSSANSSYTFPVNVKTDAAGQRSFQYVVNKTYLQDLKDAAKEAKTVSVAKRATNLVKIPKELTYEKVAASVDQLNVALRQFYQSNPKPEEDKMDQDVKPFLY